MRILGKIERLERAVPGPDGPCRCGRFETLAPPSRRPEDQDRPLPPPTLCGACGGVVKRFVVVYAAKPFPEASR
ncbi:MAG: hypothetical protein ACKVU4_00375 [Phycisphaerales bacterium]